MKCLFCGNLDSKVIDSRAMDENTAIRRRRQCEKCGKRFTTYERIDKIPLVVIKKDGTRETFQREKLLNGIMMSCNKLPVSVDAMETMVSEVENQILNSMSKEVDSKVIGQLVMDKLKNIDEIAYVRFAAVYKQFKDIDSFMVELSSILSEKKNNS